MEYNQLSIKKYITQLFPDGVKDISPQELHATIGQMAMDLLEEQWEDCRHVTQISRHACYLSMEFLMGRMIFNNLLCMGILDTTDDALVALQGKLDTLECIEDAALGNGGLGRLAACFLDSAATLSLPLDGYGIRYRYGLFKQQIREGKQFEMADDWTRYGDVWSVRRENESVLVRYADQTVKAVPYDMPIIGYEAKHIGTLRLWQAESELGFDFQAFNRADYMGAHRKRIHAEEISYCLYPNDDTDEGKKLRLRQQYFFCSASLQDQLAKHFANGFALSDLPEKLAIQLNDTHPVIAIPEFIRLVMQKGVIFDTACEYAVKIFRYTNHTIMAEALEKWRCDLVAELLPEVYQIITLLHERLITDLYAKGADKNEAQSMRIIQNGMIHMAHMAIYMGSFVNGVAEIHSGLLKTQVLSSWYKHYPERFSNKTNGITQRRWLALCNRELSEMLTDLLGDRSWVTQLSKLTCLDHFADDLPCMDRFLTIKTEKKLQLAKYIYQRETDRFASEKEAIAFFDPEHAVFDIQIKRLHEYKRQLMAAFSILYLYYEVKDRNLEGLPPVTFLFGAKAAPGYRRAKAIIEYINAIAKHISEDKEVCNKIKVFFVSDYNVSYAEKLVAAADISEQISTAGTEASGTGNMKLMLNGAVTLGTYDGANIEIVEEAGEENNYIFGARVEELQEIIPEYDSRKILADNPKIRRVVQTLIDGTFGIHRDFQELYDSLTEGASWHAPDHYYVLGDLQSYCDAKIQALRDYASNRNAFAQKQWHNITHAGKFSSDRTIAEYAEEIWQITPIPEEDWR